MKPEAVLFDLDGTLLDSTDAFRAVYERLPEHLCRFIRAQGALCKEEEVERMLREFDKVTDPVFEYDKDLWWPEIIKKYVPSLNPPMHFIMEMTLMYWRIWEEMSRPYPDAEPTLEYLSRRGYLLGLISDTDGLVGEKRRRILQQSRVTRFFKVVVVSGEDTEMTKADPQPFLVAAKKLGVEPKRCLYVGDTPHTDVHGASRAGMRTVLVYRGGWKAGIYPDYI
ncbi:MAG: HAD-IA family hydrolase, partial [Candidatus Bathyarchaeia archaeon]